MKIENISLTINGVNFLGQISCNFDFNKIYALVGDTSVNVFLRILCGLVSPTTGKVTTENNATCGIFLNDMHFITDFNAQETIEDISSKQLTKKEINELLNKLDLFKDSKLKISKYQENMLKKLGILCTTLNNNKIILIEDVFKGLLPSDIDMVRELFINLKSKGYLIILTGRKKEKFTYFADKIYEIEKDIKNEIL